MNTIKDYMSIFIIWYLIIYDSQTSSYLESFITCTENDIWQKIREEAQKVMGDRNGCFERQGRLDAFLGICCLFSNSSLGPSVLCFCFCLSLTFSWSLP